MVLPELSTVPESRHRPPAHRMRCSLTPPPPIIDRRVPFRSYSPTSRDAPVTKHHRYEARCSRCDAPRLPVVPATSRPPTGRRSAGPDRRHRPHPDLVAAFDAGPRSRAITVREAVRGRDRRSDGTDLAAEPGPDQCRAIRGVTEPSARCRPKPNARRRGAALDSGRPKLPATSAS
jgi:hypothetical protein